MNLRYDAWQREALAQYAAQLGGGMRAFYQRVDFLAEHFLTLQLRAFRETRGSEGLV